MVDLLRTYPREALLHMALRPYGAVSVTQQRSCSSDEVAELQAQHKTTVRPNMQESAGAVEEPLTLSLSVVIPQQPRGTPDGRLSFKRR
jgi:hypothetical protein